MIVRKEINTVAKSKNTKARKNFNICIGNEYVKVQITGFVKTC